MAGSVNYIGARVLATLGALRSGVGLATLAVPGELLPIVAAQLTEATFLPLPSDMGVLIERAVEPLFKALAEREYKALLVGCGLGREKETQALYPRPAAVAAPRRAYGRGAASAPWASAWPRAAPPTRRQSAGQGRGGEAKRTLPAAGASTPTG